MAIQCFSHLHCSNSSKKENLARSRRCVVHFLKLMMDQILKNNFPVIALSGRITLHCHTDNYQILWQVQTHCLVILAWKPSVHKNTTMENVQLAPGTCGRHQFESEWWDGWVGGGVPFFINLTATHKNDQLHCIQLQHSNTCLSWEAWAQFVDMSALTQGLPCYLTCLDEPGGIISELCAPIMLQGYTNESMHSKEKQSKQETKWIDFAKVHAVQEMTIWRHFR